MTLTAEEIQSQQFRVRFRGFDTKEVDSFLEKAAAAFQAVADENQLLKSQIEQMESELAEHKNQQKSFQSAMVAAQGIVDEMKAKSKVDAERILSQAREQARGVMEEANGRIISQERELDRLGALKSQIQEELRQRLNSYLDMIEPSPFSTEFVAQASAATALSPAAPAPSLTLESTEAGGEDELADLYVSIDLPEDTLSDLMEDGAASMALEEPEGMAVMALEEDEKEPADGPAIPDLEGEMSFSLEDPFDDSMDTWKKKEEH